MALSPLKILIAHNNYKKAGGEDTVVANELSLLRAHDHDAVLYRVDNHTINTPWKKIKAALHVGYCAAAKKAFATELTRVRPDVVHVHNFFPLLTPSIYDACESAGVPVVQTLHNYRLICPSALLLRDGKVCELCVTGTAYHGTRYACYRGSYLGSFFVSRMVQRHRKQGTWETKVDRYIALTEFARSKFIEGGLPERKIQVKPNFYLPPKNYSPPKSFVAKETASYAFYMGRLSEEKGIRSLLEAWKHVNYPLYIAGTGPLLDFIQQHNNPNIKCLGFVNAEEIHQYMMKANFLVLPSVCYEGFPMVIVEAFAHGLPVIASRLGAMKEIVEDQITGIHFEPGNSRDLAEKINFIIQHPDKREQMARNAYNKYVEKYTLEKNYNILMDIYSNAISSYALHHSHN